MLYQSILPIIIVIVYFLYCLLKRQIEIAYKFFNDTFHNNIMAINSDLNSKKITDIEAEQKRKLLYSHKNTSNSIHFIFEKFLFIYTSTLFILLLINILVGMFKSEIQNVYIFIIIILNVAVGILLIILCNKMFKRPKYFN